MLKQIRLSQTMLKLQNGQRNERKNGNWPIFLKDLKIHLLLVAYEESIKLQNSSDLPSYMALMLNFDLRSLVENLFLIRAIL